MEIKNYLEEIVIRIGDNLIDKDKDFCKCKQCRLDVITYSLNRLRPKYASSLTGNALTAVDTEHLTIFFGLNYFCLTFI